MFSLQKNRAKEDRLFGLLEASAEEARTRDLCNDAGKAVARIA